MAARQSVTISRDTGGRSSSASRGPAPDPVAGGPVIAVAGGRVDPVARLRTQPDQADPVPDRRTQLTDLRRGDPRLGQMPT